jgi:hypothetical protein
MAIFTRYGNQANYHHWRRFGRIDFGDPFVQNRITSDCDRENEFLRHKVCGEYVSNEVLPYLQWLGVEVSELKPTQISKIIFSTASGKIVRGKLPLGGFGISRYALDEFLHQKALSNGCWFALNR